MNIEPQYGFHHVEVRLASEDEARRAWLDRQIKMEHEIKHRLTTVCRGCHDPLPPGRAIKMCARCYKLHRNAKQRENRLKRKALPRRMQRTVAAARARLAERGITV